MLKKTIIILLVLSLIPVSIKAEKIHKIYTNDYYIEGENPKEYQNKSDKYIIKEYEKEIKPEEKTNRIITEKTKYGYNQILTRYIVINAFTIQNENNISELSIYNKKENKIIEYKGECTYCENEILEKLKDKIYKQQEINNINKAFTLLIDLNEEYNPNDISVELTFQNKESKSIQASYSIWLLDFKPTIIKSSSKYIQAPVYKREINTITQELEHKTITTNFIDEDIKNKNYKEKIIYLPEKTESLYYKFQAEKVFYNYQDKLFKYYKIEKTNKNKNIITSNTQEKTKNNTEKNKPTQLSNITKKNQIKQTSKVSKISNKKQDNKKTKINTIKKQKKENILSTSNITKKTKFDKKLLLIFGIFLMLISLMVYAIYKLKKEQ